jgi:hypothetical protein
LGRALRQLAHKRKIGPSFSCLMRQSAHEKKSQASFLQKIYSQFGRFGFTSAEVFFF